MGCGLFVGVAVEIGEVVHGGWRESWRDHAWWFRWGSCSGGDPWVAVSCGYQWVCLWLNERGFCEREVRIFLFYFILF